MKSRDYRAVPTVWTEDEKLHTDESPFCDDRTCPCHIDVELLTALSRLYELGLITAEEQFRIFEGRQLVEEAEQP